MATFTVTIPDDKKDEIIDAICANYRYQETVTDPEGLEIPNPMTKAQFAKRKLAEFVKENLKSYKVSQVVETARDAAIVEADAVDIT